MDRVTTTDKEITRDILLALINKGSIYIDPQTNKEQVSLKFANTAGQMYQEILKAVTSASES